MWTLDLADEIESDLSAFHRIDDPMKLDSARYFRLTELLPAYDGAVRRRFQMILHDAREQGPAPAVEHGAPEVNVSTASAEVLAARSEVGAQEFPGFEYRK